MVIPPRPRAYVRKYAYRLPTFRLRLLVVEIRQSGGRVPTHACGSRPRNIAVTSLLPRKRPPDEGGLRR